MSRKGSADSNSSHASVSSDPLNNSRTRLTRHQDSHTQSWRRRIQRTDHVSSLEGVAPLPVRPPQVPSTSAAVAAAIRPAQSIHTSSSSSAFRPMLTHSSGSTQRSSTQPSFHSTQSSDQLHMSAIFGSSSSQDNHSSEDGQRRQSNNSDHSGDTERTGRESAATTASGWTQASTVQLAHRWTTVHRRSGRLTNLLPSSEQNGLSTASNSDNGRQGRRRMTLEEERRTRLNVQKSESDDKGDDNGEDEGGGGGSGGSGDNGEDDENDRSRIVYRAPEILYTPSRRRSSSLAPPGAEAFIMDRKR